ncbi:hypothetical protein [Altererythrobacter sp. Root672]|uniref:hypothetical protein n=1 Tax=Altererythrobacter sp. Root672 TaxID=1736584 RepID=UPI000AC1930C|nr:hypothetical protein [Altererythrobacter sp. Root672]
MAEEYIPDEIAAGLDLFAATWLQQWSEAGGSVQIDAAGRASIGWPSYSHSPECVEVGHDLPDTVRSNQRTFRSGMYDGKMRALLELIDAVPCGHDALKLHMRQHGLAHYLGRPGTPT